MAEIILKGRREPIKVSYNTAIGIKQLFMDNAVLPTQKIEVNDWVGTKADIKSVWLDADEYKKNNNNKFDAIANANKEYIDGRKAFLALSVEQKAERTSFFEFVWYGFKQTKEIPKEVIAQVIDLQKEFFAKNVYRITPDVQIFRKILGESNCEKQVFDIMTKVVSTDKAYAEQEENYYKGLEQK